jgi:hypothetical protein
MADAAIPLAVFRQAYFGPIDQYLAWHDGFGFQTDLNCLDALTPADQAQAALELLAALRAGTADARAVLGLGHLRYAEALPLLHDCLRRNFYALYVLQAIAQIAPAGLYPPLVAEQLGSKKPTLYQHIDLLMGLREYFTLPQLGPVVPTRIFDLLGHPDYLVRYHALATLRRLYHSPAEHLATDTDSNWVHTDEIFGLITKDKCPGNYAKAQRLLLAELPAPTLAAFPLLGR